MGLDAARAAWAIFQRLAILVRAEVAHGAQRPCLVITLATLISFLSYSLRMVLIENSTLSAQLHRVCSHPAFVSRALRCNACTRMRAKQTLSSKVT